MKLFKIISFVLFVFWELLISNMEVAREVLKPVRKLRPGLIKVPLEATTDVEIAFIANAITMLPGSVTLDISDDRRYLLVHVLALEDVEKARKQIKEKYERRILELLR